MKKYICIILSVLIIATIFSGCTAPEPSTDRKLSVNTTNATDAASNIILNQPAPTDLDYSLERYNIIRRAYWVNGQREKANTLVCAMDKPLGYIVLFAGNGSIVNSFVVDGKVSSLGSYLFPAYVDKDNQGDSVGNGADYNSSVYSVEIPGIDGAYGSNVEGIFFFTPDGKYIEWTGDFLYSDIPFEVDDPVIHYKEN